MQGTYTYDSMNRRIGVDETVSGVETKTWTVYDGVNTYADFNGSGTLQTRYLNGPAVDEVLARTSSGGTSAWYLADRLGSVRDVVNTSGTVIDHVAYNAYGTVTSETNSANGDRFKFAGREFDAAINLYYNRRRYYDAVTGRFISEDPSGFTAGDTNLDRYVGNGPTDGVDPSGLFGELRVTPEGIIAAGGGHHPIPFSVWKKLGLPVEVQRIFNEVMKASPDHCYNRAHSAYNARVKQILEDWLGGFPDGLTKVTPDDARKFSEMIKNSSDPFIKGYLSRIKKPNDKIVDWFDKVGKKYLDDEAKLLAALNEAGSLSRSAARAVGTITNKLGRVFKIVAIGTAIFYVSEGGIVYAAERTVKDAIFFDELSPYVQEVGVVVDGKLADAQIGAIKNRYKQLGPEELENYLRSALQAYPDLYLLYFGEEPVVQK
jgi:RHS repeat-associated protein